MTAPQVTHFADDATLAHIAKLEADLAEANRRLSEASSSWIPVTKRMPEYGEYVLMTHSAGRWKLVGCYGNNGGRAPVFMSQGAYYAPTHWMPLPEAPK